MEEEAQFFKRTVMDITECDRTRWAVNVSQRTAIPTSRILSGESYAEVIRYLRWASDITELYLVRQKQL